MAIIITMAGKGTRFREYCSKPKYMIGIKGKTMFEWALESLYDFFEDQFIFICLKEHKAEDFIIQKCSSLSINKIKIIQIDEPTAGQAETALLGKKAIGNVKEGVIIYNIDTHVERGELKQKDIKGDGWIPCFKAEGEHWSFIRFDQSFSITEIKEKNRISEYASIGFYYFKSFSLFEDALQKYYGKSIGPKEKYIAPIYEILIKSGKGIYTKILDTNKVHVLGTPKEVKEFEKR